MARNHEVTQRNNLLNADGTLREPGWSKSLIQTYNREDIAAPKFRIKEWDYYLILADKHAVAFTLSDDGYIGMQSASLLVFDEKNPWETKSPYKRLWKEEKTSRVRNYKKVKRLCL